jgi:hypothetical protein
MLRIQRIQILTSAKHTVLGWPVVDVHEAVEYLLKRGIIFDRYPGLPQDERGFGPLPMGLKSRGSLIRMGILCPSLKSGMSSLWFVNAFF